MRVDLITDVPTVEEALSRHTGRNIEVVSRTPVSGGCIANGVRLDASDECSYFLKQSATLPPAMFLAEALGLRALRSRGGPRVPQPIAVFPGESVQAGPGREPNRAEQGSFVLMEWIETGRPGGGFHRRFGQQLARMHDELTGERFGFPKDNFIGSTPQPNSWRDSWCEFFAEVRLGFQVRLAVDHGRVDARTAQNIESIMRRAGEFLVEPAAPSLLHGDLWGGNYLCDATGEPVLIDPATYYGHPEADLAMTELFGGFRPDFYRAYEAESPLAPGYKTRKDLYNLYHMLNHLNIFGGSYLGSVQSIAARYA